MMVKQESEDHRSEYVSFLRPDSYERFQSKEEQRLILLQRVFKGIRGDI